MIGVIVGAFGDFVKERCSREAQEILDSKLSGITLISTEDYSDGVVLDVIGAVAAAERKTTDQLLEQFGRHFISWAQPKYRMAYVVPDTKTFLLGMKTVHGSTRKFNPKAQPPEFEYEDSGPDRLVMVYSSPRKLCVLMRGLIQGVADHFGEKVRISEASCMKKGHAKCRFELEFSKG